MKHYLELTDTPLTVKLAIGAEKSTDYTVSIGGRTFDRVKYASVKIDNLAPFSIEILTNAPVFVNSITIDGIPVIPYFNHLAIPQTNYVTSKWTLTFDQPFYRWLHQARSQGWLLKP